MKEVEGRPGWFVIEGGRAEEEVAQEATEVAEKNPGSSFFERLKRRYERAMPLIVPEFMVTGLLGSGTRWMVLNDYFPNWYIALPEDETKDSQ